MAGVMKRRFEKRLETAQVLRGFLDSALVDAGVYCAILVLKEDAHDSRCPADRLNRISLTYVEIRTREGDGWDMVSAAMSAVQAYMNECTLEKGWFSGACRAGKKAARTVFHAGNDRSSSDQQGLSFDELHGVAEHEKRVYARYYRGETPPPLRDEPRYYRTRKEGKFYVCDAVVPAQQDSIFAVEAMAKPTGKRGAHAMKMAYKAVHNASKRYGEEYAESLNQRFSKMYREERLAEMIELAYSFI